MSKQKVLNAFGAAAPRLTRRQWWWIIGGLVLLVLIAYGQTLGMYFWQDDAALLFKMQHPLLNSGSFGSGWYGNGAYKYLATPFIPLLPLFGLNPLPYFALGIGIYFLLALTVFWFLRILTQNNRIAVSGAALFSVGYFSQLAIFRLINSYQTNMSVILALITFGILILYYLKRDWRFYLAGVLLFAATLELMLVRSHGLILPLVALEILFFLPFHRHSEAKAKQSRPKKSTGSFALLRMTINTLGKNWFGQLVFSILRLTPFLWIYKFFYFNGNESSGGALDSLIQTYLVEGNWENFLGLAASFGNMMIPDATIIWFSELTGQSIGPTNWSHILILLLFLVVVWYTKARLRLHQTFAWLGSLLGFGWLLININGASAQYLWYQDFATILAGTIGGLAIVYFALLGLYLWKSRRLLAVAILFAVVWSVANYFGYFVLYPTSVMTSTSRYVMHSFVATVALWAILIELLILHRRTKKRAQPEWLPTAVATVVIAVVPLSLTLVDQKEWVAQKSVPTRNFYRTMQELYPQLEYGALIWYDTKRDPAVEYAFGDFFSVGSMPEETALAIYYGIDRYDLKLSSSANNFLGEAFHWKKLNDQLYTFYYDGQQLHDTTLHTRAALAGELETVTGSVEGTTVNPDEPVGMSTPVVASFDLSAEVKPAQELESSGAWDGDIGQLSTYFRYLLARDQLRQDLDIEVSSEWSGAEKEFLTDGDYSKGWVAHRTIWPVEGHATVTAILPRTMEINRLLWANSHTIRTPTDYTIEVSQDGSHWTTVKEVVDAAERTTGELVADDFDPVTARYVRMVITQTATKEAPGLIEFEVVPSQFGRLDPALAAQLEADPLLGAQDEASKQALARYLQNHTSVTVTYQTDRATHPSHDPIDVTITDATDYAVVLPASGTNLEEVTVVAPDYLNNVTLGNVQFSFPTLDELNDRGFIQRRSKN